MKTATRCGRAATLAWAALLATAPLLRAQRISVAAGYTLAHYSEQARTLSFDGSGPTAELTIGVWRIDAVGTVSRLWLAGASSARLAGFTQTDISVGVVTHVVSLVGIEAAYEHRTIAPADAAQAFDAFRGGVRIAVPLAPDAEAHVRADYVGAGRFSGGGSAPLGVGLGVGFGYGLFAGHLRLVGDFNFERLDRQTHITDTTHDVPIQLAAGTLGLALAF